jgi:hypothetical protein
LPFVLRTRTFYAARFFYFDQLRHFHLFSPWVQQVHLCASTAAARSESDEIILSRAHDCEETDINARTQSIPTEQWAMDGVFL